MNSAERPLVSIVTPTIDRAALLEQTIRSVQQQTYMQIEHIVIDGGSKDGTVDLLRRLQAGYAAPNHELRWLSEPDGGMYDAVNKGLRISRGDVVAYLNSDDRYFPWSVARAVAALQGPPATDIVFGDVMRTDDRVGTVVPIFQPPPHARRMAAYGTLFQPTVFVRKSVFDRLGGFDSDLQYVADLDFWLRAAEHFQFTQVSEFLALERRHLGMLSETAAPSMQVEDRRMRNAHRKGFWSTAGGPIAGRVEWQLWSSIRWLRFVRATRGGGPGWEHTVQSCRPRVSKGAAVAGMLPSKGSRLRSGIDWQIDPRVLAAES